jgi:hypothetical protein
MHKDFLSGWDWPMVAFGDCFFGKESAGLGLVFPPLKPCLFLLFCSLGWRQRLVRLQKSLPVALGLASALQRFLQSWVGGFLPGAVGIIGFLAMLSLGVGRTVPIAAVGAASHLSI